MLEQLIHDVLPIIIHLIEIIGIIVIAVGSLKAFYLYVVNLFTGKDLPVKIELGNAMAMGLEFKLGAEILKTVLISNFEEIGMLGAIILLRALLTFIIHWEMKNEKHH